MTDSFPSTPTALIADDVRVEPVTQGAARLSCRLDVRGGPRPPDLPPRVWYEIPADAVGEPPLAAADPFLPLLTVAAMKRGIPRVVLDGPVSPRLLETVPRIMDIFVRWGEATGIPMRRVVIEGQPMPAVRRGTASGAFFSGGVDSFFTLLRNRDRYPPTDCRHVRHLIVLHGFDVPLDAPLFQEVQEQAEATAHEMGARVVVLRTNARAALRGVDWNHFAHGPMLAGAALALSGLLHTMFVASGRAFLEPIKPTASHFAVDPLWSTEAMELVHDGAETTREDKVRRVVASPVALRYLRVCWENPGGAYNCGKCEKCLRTMVELHLWGALGRAERLPDRLDPAVFAKLIVRRPDYWERLLERIQAPDQDPARWVEIRAAIELALGRWRRQQSAAVGLRATLRRKRQRARHRLRGLDAALGGVGGRLLQRWRRARRASSG